MYLKSRGAFNVTMIHMENQSKIRVKSLAWITDLQALFVVKMFDRVKGDFYYRPVGGTVEFGETALETLHRELKEELNTTVAVTGSPLILENIFVCDGVKGHEIDYLFPCKFNDPVFYERKRYALLEADGTTWDALWIPIADCLTGTYRLVPEVFVERIRNQERNT